MKLNACIREVEGKNMTIGWIGLVHCAKWMMAEHS